MTFGAYLLTLSSTAPASVPGIPHVPDPRCPGHGLMTWATGAGAQTEREAD